MEILSSFFIPLTTRFGMENVGYVVDYARKLFPKECIKCSLQETKWNMLLQVQNYLDEKDPRFPDMDCCLESW